MFDGHLRNEGLCTGEGSSGAIYRLSSIAEPAKLYCMGPDYAALLTACAAHLWLQPMYLHKGVINLESRMRLLESAAADGFPAGL